MIAAALRRSVELLTVLFGVSVLTFLMIRLVPGDAAQLMLGANDATPEQMAALRAQLGLDLSLPAQYFRWLGRALHGDLGSSIWTGRPVLEEVLPRIGVTLELTAFALALACVLAVPLGWLMASTRRRWADAAVRLASIAGLTVPSFWLGTMLLYAAATLAPDAEVLGWVAWSDDPAGHLRRLLLPVVSLALPVLAGLSRLVRASMVDALRQDYVRTARAKGLSETQVVGVHAWRNAMLPFLTGFGITAGYLFGGSVVVEQVFAIPGLGRLMLGAVAERNYPLVQAGILLATAGFVAINAVVDLLYAAADPRVRRG